MKIGIVLFIWSLMCYTYGYMRARNKYGTKCLELEKECKRQLDIMAKHYD